MAELPLVKFPVDSTSASSIKCMLTMSGCVFVCNELCTQGRYEGNSFDTVNTCNNCVCGQILSHMMSYCNLKLLFFVTHLIKLFFDNRVIISSVQYYILR